MSSTLAKDALRRLVRQRWMLSLLVLTTLVAMASGYAGLAWRSALEASLAAPAAAQVVDRTEWLDAVARADRGEDVQPFEGRPMSFPAEALLPPGPLADFAYAGESVHPREARINGFRTEVTLFRRYELSGPVADRLVRADLGFVATAVLPLVLLLLTFDVLSSERDGGRLLLLRAQGVRPLHLVVVRIGVVLALLISLLVLVTGCAALAAEAPGRLAAWFRWLMVAVAHLVFWGALAGAIAFLARSSRSAAFLALSAWMLLVVIAPSSAQFLADAVHPAPSRVAYLAAARAAEADARRSVEDLSAVYLAEHPQTEAPDASVPGFYRSAWLAARAISEETGPVRDRFESSHADRESLLERLRPFAPTLLAASALTEIAGAGAARAVTYRHQTLGYHAALMSAIGPATMGNRRLNLAEAEALPAFSFVEPQQRSLLPALSWLILATVLTLVAARAIATRSSEALA